MKNLKKQLHSNLGFKKIINYYGMVEQNRINFFESEKCKYFHTNIFSDVFVRNREFKDIGFKKKGYFNYYLYYLPVILAQHYNRRCGVVFGEDDCKCGKKENTLKFLTGSKNLR